MEVGVMKMMKATSAALAMGAIGLLMTGSVSLARDAMTLHIEVISDDDAGESMKMAMPIDLIAAMAGSIDTDKLVTVDVLDELSHEGFDLRKFWEQIKDSDINEFFSLEVKDAKIRAWRADGMFRITVDASESDQEFAGRKGAMVEITVPEGFMDILIDSDGRIEPENLVATLRSMGPMTLVHVETDKESVRVWLE